MGRGLHKRMVASVIVVLTMTACGSAVPGIDLGDSATSTVPSSTTSTTETTSTSTTTVTPSTTSTTPVQEIGKVGDTLSLTASPIIGPGTPEFNVTLNQLIDPADIEVPGFAAPQGERYVEMNVAIANVGSTPLPVQGSVGPYVLGFTWYLNPSNSVPDSGQEYTQDFPNATCQGNPQAFTQEDVAPGQSITGCVQFGPISDSIVVTGFEASLAYGGSNDLYPAIWQIS